MIFIIPLVVIFAIVAPFIAIWCINTIFGTAIIVTGKV